MKTCTKCETYASTSRKKRSKGCMKIHKEKNSGFVTPPQRTTDS